MHEIDVTVIGAGAAGVAAARRLADARVPCVLIEARRRVGGRALTLPGEFALDLGCGWLHSANENEWAELAPKLGFAIDDFPPPWARPAWEGNFPPAEQKEYWAAWHSFYQRVDAAEHKDLLLSDCYEPGNRFNPMIGAVVTYANGAEAEKITTREYALYHDTAQNKRIERGYGTLIAAYAAGLDVRLDCPVSLIDHTGKRLRIVTARARTLRTHRDRRCAARHDRERSTALLSRSASQDGGGPRPAARRRQQGVSADRQPRPRDTRVTGSRVTHETGMYTLRAFGRPVIEGYFGGRVCGLARRRDHAVRDRAALRGARQRHPQTPDPDHRVRLGQRSWSLGSYSYGSVGAEAARAAPRGTARRPAVLCRRAHIAARFLHGAWRVPPPASRRRTRRSEPCEFSRRDRREPEAPPRQRAGLVARLTGAAHIRPHRVDGARGRDADFACSALQRLPVQRNRAAHVIDIVARIASNSALRFEREARPSRPEYAQQAPHA
ncbi:MAG: FAD-dependent oxidoreductase [Alphaproteobacteria bacterium]